ncbi:Glycosyltransferase, catalytic subunit of cellulose synthase and poly-beta-1,6-N-acetylglucosamine synthase [Parafrankia irregularis]|uniref:Glycosyltransferase, catalytic subunit of cellulose synthase and poly-beta-1,6-N-acetylglucosamine synthase n=1 Tax=Parafrankia irregularis TaxID=795642 RepID=A0A0S4QLD1_9ACTN|nr:MULTISPECIES: glycosyltransferase family 2 protein [Parafrankia]MBE3203794.1 glycosyltransferase family 2 protein [Parafrankia sp. CH37]CUU55338.1 Glycosyltransferase, catalytic subunit of cellulose synthase and poly-beta-1,6-N-acetylglucosamine synthase [Parafrankia irregularis]
MHVDHEVPSSSPPQPRSSPPEPATSGGADSHGADSHGADSRRADSRRAALPRPARHRLRPRPRVWLLFAALGLVIVWAAIRLGPTGFVVAAWSAVSLIMFIVAALTLSRTQFAWQRPERVDHVDLTDQEPPQVPISLIVPARDEPVLGRTLQQILAGDYPHELLQILVVVSEDEIDRETREIAQSYADRYPCVEVIAPRGDRRSKPISLEDARPYCHGDLIGVVDAESLIAAGLLGHVNTIAVRHPDVGIIQGGVQLMNIRAARGRDGTSGGGSAEPPAGDLGDGSAEPQRRGRSGRRGPKALIARFLTWCNEGTSWWRVRNCLEYYVWFMSRLRFQAQARLIPLGGNTVFVRRDVLTALGGWDATALTEDCDLGIRSSARGVRTLVFYHPALTTREETPESLQKLVVQRSRWMLGFIQVLLKGDWRDLPTLRQRLLAIEMLAMPFFQALAGLLLPTSLILIFVLRAPVVLVLLYWLPLGIAVMLVVAEQAAFGEFRRSYRLRSTWLDSVRLVIGAPFYQLVLSAAALRATIRLLRGQLEWEKTTHLGAHHIVPTPRDPNSRERDLAPRGLEGVS